jgi:hypothetical protein
MNRGVSAESPSASRIWRMQKFSPCSKSTIPAMAEADELKMIDGFLTTVFAEDTATLRAWS